jgi:hypothetical protein
MTPASAVRNDAAFFALADPDGNLIAFAGEGG